jgi:4-aminobutyrate aminotransferase-like enzyme
MALAQLSEIKRLRLGGAAAVTGRWMLKQLAALQPTSDKWRYCVRGRGLMLGLEIRDDRDQPATREVVEVVKRLLQRGFILLPEGEHANVISFTPPLTITRPQLTTALTALERTLSEMLPS